MNIKYEEPITKSKTECYEKFGDMPELKPFLEKPELTNDDDLDNFDDSNDITKHFPVMAFLENEKTSGKDVLYLAPGFGLGMKMLEVLGFNVKGIDINDKYVKYCRQLGLDVIKGDAISLDNITGKYDIIISRDFFRFDYLLYSYKRNLNDSLRRQHSLLKENGRVILYSCLEEDALSTWEKDMEKDIEDLPFSEWNRYTMMLKIISSEQRYKIEIFKK